MSGRLKKYQLGKLFLLVAILNSLILFIYFRTENQTDLLRLINLDNFQYVIQFSDKDNLCVAVSKMNTLIVGMCHMNSVNPFVFDKGILRSLETGYCVGEEPSNWRLLQLTTCEYATKLTLINNTLVQQTRNFHQQQFCVSVSHRGKALLHPRLGASAALVPCYKAASRTSLVLQTKILEDIWTPPPVVSLPPEMTPCDSPACGMVGRFRIQFSYEGRCLGVTEDNKPVVSFCNPQESQAFFYSNGTFTSVERAMCIGVAKSESKDLILTHRLSTSTANFDMAGPASTVSHLLRNPLQLQHRTWVRK